MNSLDNKRDAPRRDIQGLRALAVVVVIVNHLFGWPKGGFVGVDVFFVVSGFLITGLLYREHQRTGRISFGNFYRRRARRILPLALLVTLVTVVAGFFIYLRGQAFAVLFDGFWASVFAANWHEAYIGTQYFAQGEATSPLQHYWSLAVEEQFYLVWPWLLVIVLGLKGRRMVTRSRLLLLAMGVLTAASLSYSLWESATYPGVAYFNTLSRCWELGVGAMLAIATPYLSRMARGLRPILGGLGLAIVIGSLFVVTEQHFPAPWALLPVLGTAMVIAAGTGTHSHLYPIANPVTNYVGDLSYSLYLWHFPIVILLGALLPPGIFYDELAIAATLGLAIASHHLLENPVRHSQWLEPKVHEIVVPDGFVKDRRGEWVPVLPPVVRVQHKGVRLGFGSLAAVVAIAALSITALQVRPDAQAAAPAEITAKADQEATVAQQEAVATASVKGKFPTFTPKVDDLDTQKWLDTVAARNCMGWDTEPEETGLATLKSCDAGDPSAEKNVVLLGDSYAAAWIPAVSKAFLAKGWQVHISTKQQCPAAMVDVVTLTGGAYTECNSHRDWSLEWVRENKPDLVILADAEDTQDRLASGATGASAAAELQKGYETTLDQVTPYAKRTVLLTPPPAGKALQGCVTRVGKPQDCQTQISGTWHAMADAMEEAAARPKTDFVDTSGWFCTSDGKCPGFVGNTPVRVDDVHLTTTMAESLAPVLSEALGL